MECKCKNGKFWIGLGLGTVLGMVAYHCAKSDKVNEWKQRVSCAAQSAAEKAGSKRRQAPRIRSSVKQKSEVNFTSLFVLVIRPWGRAFRIRFPGCRGNARLSRLRGRG